MTRPIPALLLLLPPLGCGPAAPEPAAAGTADAAEVPDARAVRVEVARIEPSEARLDLELPGEVEGSRDAVLAAPQGGLVEAVRVHTGQAVARGQVLVLVDASVARARRDQAEAQAALARSELERLEKMGDLASPQQLEQARTQVQVAEATLALAEAQLSRAVVRAPFSGVIASVDVEEGEVVAPARPVVRLVRLDPARVALSVADRDVVALEEGTPARVRVDATGADLAGHVAAIEPAADLETRAFRVEVEVPNPDRRLLPGMIATVLVDRVVDEDAVVIPQDWLVTRRDGVGVFVVADGRARWRPVHPARVVGEQVVLADGLQPGETIVITGHRELEDGDPLLVSRSGRCCENGRPIF